MQFDTFGQPITEPQKETEVESPKDEQPKQHVFGKFNIPPDVVVRRFDVGTLGITN
jgi:hypothetical protein